MDDYPEYVKVNEKIYKINTDFRVAIECNRIAEDIKIGDFERALAIIYLLFGDEGLNDVENHQKLMELAKKYLSCEEMNNRNENDKPDMDYIEDKKYIKSSFKYDYQYDPYSLKYLHWYEFYNDLNNLSNSEFGTCCILNRIRSIRNYDTSQIKDDKERKRIEKMKEYYALKKNKKEENLTKKQEESMEELNKLLGL